MTRYLLQRKRTLQQIPGTPPWISRHRRDARRSTAGAVQVCCASQGARAELANGAPVRRSTLRRWRRALQDPARDVVDHGRGHVAGRLVLLGQALPLPGQEEV